MSTAHSSMTYDPAIDEARLAELAAQFRAMCDEPARRRIADDYARTVEKLIDSRAWHESPPPEHQLPDERMPQAFFDYWRDAATAS